MENRMESLSSNSEHGNLTEQIKKLTSSHGEFGADKYTFMMVIASLSWVLLTCLSIFIYCCNYWTLFETAEHRAASRLQEEQEGQELDEEEDEDDEESSQQSELEQQSMLLTQAT